MRRLALGSPLPVDDGGSSVSQRVDVWLDVACLFKTRSQAQAACRGGKVEINGQVARPHRLVRSGDELCISRGGGLRQIVLVRGLAPRHVARAEARALYEDRTPPLTPDELEARRLRRAFATPTVSSRPASKRDRRALRRLKRGG
jgi:ribosome-associated heat shock protein Hsp15